MTNNWRTRAVCQTEDTELFFPVGDSGPGKIQINKAMSVCARCPVQPDCLEWALVTGQDYGIYGGMTPTERRKLKRRSTGNAA